jgi:hypothetical protein
VRGIGSMTNLEQLAAAGTVICKPELEPSAAERHRAGAAHVLERLTVALAR